MSGQIASVSAELKNGQVIPEHFHPEDKLIFCFDWDYARSQEVRHLGYAPTTCHLDSSPLISLHIGSSERRIAKASSGVERKLIFTLLRAHHEFFAHSLAFVRAKIRHLEPSRREKPNVDSRWRNHYCRNCLCRTSPDLVGHCVFNRPHL
jgi:hypothetical protein